MVEAAVDAYRFGPFTFDVRNRGLTRDGQPVALKPKTALLLLVLLEAGGQTLSRQDIKTRVWPDTSVSPQALFFQISLLRSALGRTGAGQKYIENLPGIGYRVVVPVEAISMPPSGPLSVANPAAPAEPTVPVSPNVALPPSHGAERSHPGWRSWIPGLSGAALMVAVLLAAAAMLLALPLPAPRIAGVRQLTHDGRTKDTERSLLADASRVYFRDTIDHAPLAVTLAGGEIGRTRTPGPHWRITDVDPAGAEYLALQRDPNEPSGQPWIVSAVSGDRRRVGEAECEEAAWSPDRRTIACANGPALVSIDVNRGTSTSIAKLPGRASRLRWAPHGQALRFSVETKADRVVSHRLWEVRSDGSGLHALLPGWQPAAQVLCGGWSPDGRYFVFEVRAGSRSDLWVLREGRSPFGGREELKPVQL